MKHKQISAYISHYIFEMFKLEVVLLIMNHLDNNFAAGFTWIIPIVIIHRTSIILRTCFTTLSAETSIDLNLFVI